MTEHERLVNDKDIQAYEKQDLNINAKIPGFQSGYNRQKQIIERSVGYGASPHLASNKADIIISGGL